MDDNKEKAEDKESYLTDDLASLESYIHDLFYFSSLPLCFVSNIGVLLEANPGFEELSQYKSFEVVGEPVEKLFSKKMIDKLAKDTFKRRAVRGRELKLVNKKGKLIPVQVFTKVRENEEGDVVGYFLTPLDVTKMKAKEEKMKKTIKELKEKLKGCRKKK